MKRQQLLGCPPRNAVHDVVGKVHHEHDDTFEEAVFTLRHKARWMRFEAMGAEVDKACGDPFDLVEPRVGGVGDLSGLAIEVDSGWPRPEPNNIPSVQGYDDSEHRSPQAQRRQPRHRIIQRAGR